MALRPSDHETNGWLKEKRREKKKGDERVKSRKQRKIKKVIKIGDKKV